MLLAILFNPYVWLLVIVGLIYGSLWRRKRTWILVFHRECRRWSGPVICGLGFLIYALGVTGFQQLPAKSAVEPATQVAAETTAPPEDHKTILEALYETAQLFVLNVESEQLTKSTTLTFAMVFATLLAVLLAGKAIFYLFRDSSVAMRLAWASDHVVICGLGRIGVQLLKDLVNANDRRALVVIEKDEEHSRLKWARELGALLVIGDATDPDILKEAGIERAGEVFIVTGSDAVNIECTLEISQVLQTADRRRRLPRKTWCTRRSRWTCQTRYSPLRCYVHLLNRDLTASVRTRSDAIEKTMSHQEQSSHWPSVWTLLSYGVECLCGTGNKLPKKCEIDVFSSLESTTRRLLQDIAASQLLRRMPASSEPVVQEALRPLARDEVAHYVIIGFDEFGQTLALQLAEQAHFQNRKRLRLTIVDHKIEEKARSFIARHPRFGPDFGAIQGWRFDPAADAWTANDLPTHLPRSAVASALATKQMPDSGAEPKRAATYLGIDYACNVQYLECLEPAAEPFLKSLCDAFDQPGVKPAILVCFEDDHKNFVMSERLRSRLQTQGYAWPIFPWMPRQHELSDLLKADHAVTTTTVTSNLHCFGECAKSVAYKEVTAAWMNELARLIHLVWPDKPLESHAQTVRAYQQAVKDDMPGFFRDDRQWQQLRDAAMAEWEIINDDPDGWKRASNRSAAIHATLKAAAAGYEIVDFAEKCVSQTEVSWPAPGVVGPLLHEGPVTPSGTAMPTHDGNIKVTPFDLSLCEMEHYRWVAERLIGGWRYGMSNSNSLKMRWQITAWESLDEHLHNPEKPSKLEHHKDAKIVRLLSLLVRSGRLKVTSLPTAGGQSTAVSAAATST